MKILVRIYFYIIPLVFISLLVLLYTGNIFLFNVVAVIIIVLIVIHRMILNRNADLEWMSLEPSEIKRMTYLHISNIILFIGIYGYLFVKFFIEEVLSQLGSV